MEKEEWINDFSKKLQELSITLSNKQLEDFFTYMELLLEWNEKMNLTAIVEPKEVMIKHFLDSLTILPYLQKNQKILDIGTGAGFPGIPIQIANSNNNTVLLDALNKRILFLEEVIQKLNIPNIKAVHARAEDFIKVVGERESYDIVISRAVAKLNVLLEYMLPFVKIGGECICMKSFDIDEELKEAKKAILVLGGQIEKIEKVTLPNTNIERKIVIIKKVISTPKQYPRKAGTPAKQPIY